MNLILLGAPGSGKGTLAKNIQAEFGLIQISTGDLLRQAMSVESEISDKLKSYMSKGELVPDELVLEILRERISQDDCKNGFILDGFPRTVPQAEALKNIAVIDGVILIDLPFDVIEQRIAGRRICSSCGEIYNTSSYDKLSCKKCGAPLYQRDDDKLETVKVRLEVYEKSTAPLIDFYSDKLYKVNASGSPEDTYKAAKTFLIKLEK